MPLQYPQNSRYNPYQEVKKPTNWPMIILIALGVIIAIGIVAYLILNPSTITDKVYDDIEPHENLDCSADVYNCDDFTTQSEAQAVFDVCEPGDIHGLDRDGNGEACEGLG